MFLEELFEDRSTEKAAVFSFGRFNPPTIGHQKLINKVYEVASQLNAEAFIVPSKTVDKKKNPLTFEEKADFLDRIYGVEVYDDPAIKSPFQMAGWLGENGYNKVVFVVGSDRVEAFKAIEHHYAKDYGGKFVVMSAGERDPDADGVEGMSASKMREAAVMPDEKQGFTLFMKGLPKGADERASLELFNLIRSRFMK